MDVQRHLEANIEKRTKDVFGPPPGKRLVIFIDDMNMPQVDEYGTQQPIALLKLFIEKGKTATPPVQRIGHAPTRRTAPAIHRKE